MKVNYLLDRYNEKKNVNFKAKLSIKQQPIRYRHTKKDYNLKHNNLSIDLHLLGLKPDDCS